MLPKTLRRRARLPVVGRPARRGWPGRCAQVWALACACLMLAACASKPLVPYSTETPPLILAPAASAGVRDARGRFREIYCAILSTRQQALPDHLPCETALTRVGVEPAGTGKPVDLGPSRRHLMAMIVPGIGYECFEPWLDPPGTVATHVRHFGYDAALLRVDALSGTAHNARQVRDAVMALPEGPDGPYVVLIGYSKGAPDILEAVVGYPEIRSRVVAVVSAAGAVGGSPLANDAEQYQANLLQHFPGSKCEAGDGRGVESLRPAVRRAWLADHPLPTGLRYYSLVTFPEPDRISSILESSYDKLARIDARNDSQMIFYDQIVPGSALVGYVNADHWALAVPIARSRPTIGAMFVTRNAYPREALTEALLRFVEEDLASPPSR